jgi:hypothetical protein
MYQGRARRAEKNKMRKRKQRRGVITGQANERMVKE